MKRKGFTLVELLAVIAILAILVIMALPAVLKMYNKARIDSFSNEVNTIIRTARQQYLLDGGNTTTYTSGSNPLNLTGNKDLEYCISINTEGKVIELQATNGSYKYERNGIIDHINSNEVSETPSGYSLSCSGSVIRFVSRQNENTITYNDEVSIGSEHFFVLNSNSSNTLLLAKYNLLVGDTYEYSYDYGTLEFQHDTYTSIETFNESSTGYGLQNENARGFTWNSDIRVAEVNFSGTNYWDNSTCQFNNYNYSCSGTRGLLSPYNSNGANYEGSPYPYVYNNSMSNIKQSLVYDPEYGCGRPQNNGYTVAYYVEEYIKKLKNDMGAPSSITGRLLSYEEASNYASIPTTYDLDINQCNIGIKQLSMDAYNYDESTATAAASTLCSGGEIDDFTLTDLINNGTIPSDYYSLVGLSNVKINMIYYTSFWTGSAANERNAFGMSYGYLGETAGAFDSFGVRPVIVVPTNAMPN